MDSEPPDLLMRLLRGVAGVALAAALGACGGAPNPPPGAGAMGPSAMGGAPGDPIGFLLESHDSLHLADSVVQQLVRLNLRLYQRNAALQMSVDTIMRNARFDPTQRDTTRMSPELRALIQPLITQRRDQTAAARDTAYAMLTPVQRDSARTLFERHAQRRRVQGPEGGRPPGRP
jgi:ribosomal protein L17